MKSHWCCEGDHVAPVTIRTWCISKSIDKVCGWWPDVLQDIYFPLPMDDCIASMSRSIVPVGCDHGGLWCYGVDCDCEGSGTIPVEYTVGMW